MLYRTITVEYSENQMKVTFSLGKLLNSLMLNQVAYVIIVAHHKVRIKISIRKVLFK
jgi:hypothetical protein